MKYGLLAAFSAMSVLTAGVSQAQVSALPGTPFKLATYDSGHGDRVALLIGDWLVDLERANEYLVTQAEVASVELPSDMKTLIEQSGMTKPRLFQIANFLEDRVDELGFAFRPDEVTLRAPIRYPWNLLAAGLNYRAHAGELGERTAIDPERDNPFLFAKSPRSTIIDPGQAFVIPRNVDTLDWEGEFSIVMGRQAKDLTLENAMDAVFGFTIMYDVSDRARQMPGAAGRYPNDWFPGKSLDNGAPMGPYVVPKEFLPNYRQLRVTTRVNGEIMQDSDTSYLIHDVEHLLRYATSVMTLWPGDVIATGTPSGVGHGRNPPVYLKPGDVVEITIEGIGTLVTPIR
jgi:2-keto-4-pentenoate hydratase/2-oxohepta-3-ene-1,7-dioic acid hydratase in catechol pathway